MVVVFVVTHHSRRIFMMIVIFAVYSTCTCCCSSRPVLIETPLMPFLRPARRRRVRFKPQRFLIPILRLFQRRPVV